MLIFNCQEEFIHLGECLTLETTQQGQGTAERWNQTQGKHKDDDLPKGA